MIFVAQIKNLISKYWQQASPNQIYFNDWSIYNPTNTCVLIYLIQCKSSQVLKAPLSVLTCEVYHPDSDKARLSVSC